MREISLTNGGITIVDDEDYEIFGGVNWHRLDDLHTSYANRCIWMRGENRRYTFSLHMVLLVVPTGFQVDHIDGDGLNNQRHNLRMATCSRNQFNARKRVDNTVGYRGVTILRGKYAAQIQANKKHMHVGSFDTALEAAHAYDEAARKHHGEFAKLNFPQGSQ